jgi:hypothetical protein
MSASQIASRLGYSKQLINYDLRELRRRWAEAQIVNVHEAKSLELEKLDALQEEADAAYQQSKIRQTLTRKKSARHGDECVHTIALNAGDPRYLLVKLACIEKRCKILGLFAAAPVADAALPDPYAAVIDNLTVNELRTLNLILSRPAAAAGATSTFVGTAACQPPESPILD